MNQNKYNSLFYVALVLAFLLSLIGSAVNEAVVVGRCGFNSCLKLY